MTRHRVHQIVFLSLVFAATGLLIYWYAMQHPYRSPLPGKAEYGYKLITATSDWYGPNGDIVAITNGMNCNNCHLDAGKNTDGIPLTKAFAHYPGYRDRSGTVVTLYKRVKDCFERSLNGSAPDSNSLAYKSIEAYLKWLNETTAPGKIQPGSLVLLPRAADSIRGKRLFTVYCSRCHGNNGAGRRDADHISFLYPPLWGKSSYTSGAGMFQLSKLARFIRYNMPFDKTAGILVITEEEAWDIAAFINSQPRPEFDISHDWPLMSTKPVDYPFGPYADSFSALRHKYGPWTNMK